MQWTAFTAEFLHCFKYDETMVVYLCASSQFPHSATLGKASLGLMFSSQAILLWLFTENREMH